jgi:hypothetical protein
MTHTRLDGLRSGAWVLVDIDSGTIVGTNVRAVRVSDVPADAIDAAHDSDSDARDLAHAYGRSVYVDPS